MQRLCPERILQTDPAEQFRGEVGYPGELELLALREGVADLDGAVVVQPQDIPGPGHLRLVPAVGEESVCVVHRHLLARAHLPDLHAAVEPPGGDAQEGHAIMMGRIHVGLDLEDEAGEFPFRGGDFPGIRGPVPG